MGREIRRVPPNWEHPRYTKYNAPSTCTDWVGEYRPCYDKTYDEAAADWLAELVKWEEGANPERYHKDYGCRYYWDFDGGPPSEDIYRPAFGVEPSWYQVYETVSEGTPVSPPFATEAEVVDYLTTHGDFWNQGRNSPLPSRENAERFVKGGYAPSMTVHRPADGSQPTVAVGIDALGTKGS